MPSLFSIAGNSLPGLILFVGAPAVLSLGAIAIAGSGWRWPYRVAAILAMLWALYPLGIWGPLAIAAYALPLLAILVTWIQWKLAPSDRAQVAPTGQAGNWLPRFTLGGLLLGVGCFGIWLAVVNAVWGKLVLLSPALVLVSALAWAGIAALAFATVHCRWGLLYAVLIVPFAWLFSVGIRGVGALAGGTTEAEANGLGNTCSLVKRYVLLLQEADPVYFWMAFWIELGVAIVVGELLIRALRQSPTRRRFAQFALAAIALLVTYPMLRAVVALAQPQPPFPPAIAGPNTLVPIFKLATKLEEIDPTPSPLTNTLRQALNVDQQAEVDQLIQHVAALAEQVGYDSADLDRNSYAIFDDKLMNLGRRLGNRARESSADDPDAACRMAITEASIGAALERNGINIDWLVGNNLEQTGLHEMIRVRERITGATRRKCIQQLQAIDRSREPVSRVIERDRAWTDRKYGWSERLRTVLGELQGHDDEADWFSVMRFDLGERRRDAFLRLLITDLSIREFCEVNGRAPDDLSELIPDYMLALPNDPFGHAPFPYRKTTDDFELYSVGVDGVDDGGRFASFWELFPVMPGEHPTPHRDLRLESISRD